MELDKEIISVLWNSIMIYRTRCLSHKNLKKEIEKDSEYNGEEDYEYFIMLYLIQAFTKEEKGIKIIHDKLINAGINKKKVNSFIYSFLKMNHKCEKGIWSWNEIEEYNIDFDKIKNTTNTYKFF
tara:strand:- start:75 stop:449 length:375 start_codon:yes stop_codon:yes gene_type:complete